MESAARAELREAAGAPEYDGRAVRPPVSPGVDVRDPDRLAQAIEEREGRIGERGRVARPLFRGAIVLFGGRSIGGMGRIQSES